MAGPFATDEQILAELKRPFGLAYSACALGTSLSRARSIRDKYKTEIVRERVQVHKQTAREVAFQLEVIESYDALKQYIDKTYGALK
jgi:hypothetical protein